MKKSIPRQLHATQNRLECHQTSKRKWPLFFQSACLGLTLYAAANFAIAAVFTDSISFNAALSQESRIESFDNILSGTVIPDGDSLGDIRYESNTGFDLVVTDHFNTTSPLNYLGSDDGFSNEFVSGDEISFSFNKIIRAFGLFIIGSPGDVLQSDLQLVGGSLSVFNSSTPEKILDDGGDVFFLGLINSDGFSNVRLNSFGDQQDPFFAFNIDDITTVNVSEPTSAALLGLGLALYGYRNLNITANLAKHAK